MSQKQQRPRDPGAEDEEIAQYTINGHTLEELDEK